MNLDLERACFERAYEEGSCTCTDAPNSQRCSPASSDLYGVRKGYIRRISYVRREYVSIEIRGCMPNDVPL